MTFICDECADAQSFVESCNAQHDGCVWRYPARLRGKGDEEMLPILMVGERSLITFDARMAEVHAHAIPSENPGIIVVRLRGRAKTMTSSLMRQLIGRFKREFPTWETFDWSNTHLEVCEDSAIVSRLPLDGSRQLVAYGNDFAANLVNAIASLRPALTSPR